MNKVLSFVVSLSAVVAGSCSSADQKETYPIAEAQKSSFMGSTSSFGILKRNEREKLSERRDRAYAFCFEQYDEARDRQRCFDWQDMSIVKTRQAETYAEKIRANGLKIDDHEFGPSTPEFAIFHHPELWLDAREYCYSIYRHAGSRDARMLGPCISNAVGFDYFGMRPIP